MKTILCYGDSNTWGYIPGTGKRYGRLERWTGILQRALGKEYQVIEEGLNARTTVLDDPTRPFKNGKDYLIPCLDSSAPLDLVVLMLGTNDLKHRFGLSAFDIGVNISVLLGLIQSSTCWSEGRIPQVLLMAPPVVARLTRVGTTDFPEIFHGAKEKSQQLGSVFRRVAKEVGCEFLDCSKIIVSSNVDGVHFDLDEHRKLGEVVAEKIKAIFSKS